MHELIIANDSTLSRCGLSAGNDRADLERAAPDAEPQVKLGVRHQRRRSAGLKHLRSKTETLSGDLHIIDTA